MDVNLNIQNFKFDFSNIFYSKILDFEGSIFQIWTNILDFLAKMAFCHPGPSWIGNACPGTLGSSLIFFSITKFQLFDLNLTIRHALIILVENMALIAIILLCNIRFFHFSPLTGLFWKISISSWKIAKMNFLTNHHMVFFTCFDICFHYRP